MLGFSKLPLLQDLTGEGYYTGGGAQSPKREDEITALKKRVEELEKRNAVLEARVQEMENSLPPHKETVDEWLVKFFNRP